MGILPLAKKVGEARLVAACKRGNSYERYPCSTIQRILDLGLDARDADGELQEEARPMPDHSNIRRSAYYE